MRMRTSQSLLHIRLVQSEIKLGVVFSLDYVGRSIFSKTWITENVDNCQDFRLQVSLCLRDSVEELALG